MKMNSYIPPGMKVICSQTTGSIICQSLDSYGSESITFDEDVQ